MKTDAGLSHHLCKQIRSDYVPWNPQTADGDGHMESSRFTLKAIPSVDKYQIYTMTTDINVLWCKISKVADRGKSGWCGRATRLDWS